MTVRTVPILLATALLLAGCASQPPAGHGQKGSEGGTAAPQTKTQPAAADAGSAGTPAAAGAASTTASTAAGADAAGGTAAATGAGLVAAAGGPGQTADERRAAIDKRLDDSLGAFGAQLRSEQQQVAHEHDAHQAAAGSAAAEGQGGGKSGDAAGSASTEVPPGGTSGRHGGSKPRDHSGDLKSERASKKPDDNAGNGAAAREIPDGSDDDVVARRLRQAAEQETDPELKEKLWKEYIDYKKNNQGK
jgi:hypothetical protein